MRTLEVVAGVFVGFAIVATGSAVVATVALFLFDPFRGPFF